MIRLEKIKIKNDTVECMAFPEDSKEGCVLRYNVKTKEKDYILPKGYEYCDVHMTMACIFFRDNYENGLPETKIIMWY